MKKFFIPLVIICVIIIIAGGVFLYSQTTRQNVRILFNTNSGLLANDFIQPVTSYFEVVYF